MANNKLEKLSNIKIPVDNIIVLTRLNCEYKWSYVEQIALLLRRELKEVEWNPRNEYPAMVISGKNVGEMVTINFEGTDKNMFTYVQNGLYKFAGSKGEVNYYPNHVLDTSKVDKYNLSVADVIEEIGELNKRMSHQSYERWLNQENRMREQREAERYINEIFDEIKEIVEE